MQAQSICHLCGDPVSLDQLEEFDGRGSDGLPVEFEQAALRYWEGDAPILAIHRACGEEDNAARAEAAYFAGGQS